MTDAPPTNWIVVGSTDNFAATRALGFSVQGFKSRHRKKAETMRAGDRLIWYVTGVKAFGGYATLTSTYFEDHTPIWKSKDPKRDAEDYPFRVKIAPELTLAESDFVPAESLARQMTYASKWPAANWTLAFQGNLHKIDDDDFELIASALRNATATVVAD